MQFFQNALVRDFGVSRDQAARCAAIFYENADYLGLIRQATTGKWLASEPTGISDQEESEETLEASRGEVAEHNPAGEPRHRRMPVRK